MEETPKVMQQDTVMQHSRMFGYRNNELLSVTRYYTTRRIYENLTKITEIETTLREDIEEGRFDPGIYFIQSDGEGRITPCSPDKIRMSNIVMLTSGARLLPIGFTPIAKTYATRISKNINELILSIEEIDEKNAKLVSINLLEEIIHLSYQAINPDEESARFIDEQKFLSVFRYLTREDNLAYLVVRRGRKISKYKNNGRAYSDAPDTPQEELLVARNVAQKHPALIMIQEDGTSEGWNGSEFWWPILLIQSNVPKTIFASEKPTGKLRRSPQKT